MLVLPFAEVPAERFSLMPDGRAIRRGAVVSESGPVSAAIELTPPMVTPITEALTADDPELAAFWKAENGRFHYDYVTFRVTFAAPEDAPVDRAWVEVRLDGDKVIAWSMSPSRVADVSKLKDSSTLGVDFKLAKAETGQEQEITVENCFLRAWREHTNQPYWEFKPTAATAIAGMFRLHLVIRRPVDLAVVGTVTARAVVDQRSFWIFRRSDPSQPASIGFDLPVAPA